MADRKEPKRKRSYQWHGHGCPTNKSPTYQTWLKMKQRCSDPKNPYFHLYGGRGIVVCDKWVHDFAQFLADVGERPSAKHSLDRINNDAGYEPGNVRWATAAEQSANRRVNVYITIDGVTKHQQAWTREAGLSPATIRERMARGITGALLLKKGVVRRGYRAPGSPLALKEAANAKR